MVRMRKIIILFILAVFIMDTLTLPVRSEGVALPPIHETLGLTPAFQPCLLRGLKLDARAPFNFEFILDDGDAVLTSDAFKAESDMLIRFFLAALTTPEKDIWVNLSPYENNRIVDDDFGRTTMGRELLAQDYILKQLTASLMHPDTVLGKKFWDKIYAEAWQRFGTTDIPVDTFNKVWIMPASAVVYEGKGAGAQGGQDLSGFIDEARLKVMLETDYLAAAHGTGTSGQTNAVGGNTQDISKQVVRDVILPALEKEVNEGKNFARLRQVYYSLLLAVWLKKKLQSVEVGVRQDEKNTNILSRIFVDRKKTGGIETPDPRAVIDDVYTLYVQAFKQGAYNLIKEDQDKYSGELIPRKYFSGGFEAGKIRQVIESRMEPLPGWVQKKNDRFQRVSTLLEDAKKRLRPGSLFRRTVLTVMLAITPVNTLQASMILPGNKAMGVSALSLEAESVLKDRLGVGLETSVNTADPMGVSGKSDTQLVREAVSHAVVEMNGEYRERKWGEISEDRAWDRMGITAERLAHVLRESWEGTEHIKTKFDFPRFVRVVTGLIARESSFDHREYNDQTGATGLLQMLERFTAANLINPETNIRQTVKLWEKQLPYLEKKAAALERILQGRGALNARDIKNRFHRLPQDPRLAKVYLDKDNKLNVFGWVVLFCVMQDAGPNKSVRTFYVVMKNTLTSLDKGKKLAGKGISGFVTYVVQKSGIVLEAWDDIARSKGIQTEKGLLTMNNKAGKAKTPRAVTRTTPLRLTPLEDKIVGEYKTAADDHLLPMRTPEDVKKMKAALETSVNPLRLGALSPLALLASLWPNRNENFSKMTVTETFMRRRRENESELELETGEDSAADTTKGGIDLNTGAMDLRLRGDGGEIRFELTPAQVEMIRQGISGFVPVILEVKPMDNMPFFLGLDGGKSSVPAS